MMGAAQGATGAAQGAVGVCGLDATVQMLDASRRALGSIARPDEAKIRPYGDGARLHIGIPADTVNLRRKGRKK